MRKTKLNPIGKIGQRNIQANKTLKYIYNDYGITTCELGEILENPNCTYDNFLSFAHDHKRVWFQIRGNEDKLATFKHTVLACTSCHDLIEDDKEKTKQIFNELRP